MAVAEDEQPPQASGSKAKKPRKNAAKAGKNKRQIKHRKEINRCEHVTDHYYASGMCKNCYHSKGRVKMAELCDHKDRKLYARGVCKACYLRDYHNRLRTINEEQPPPSQEAVLNAYIERDRRTFERIANKDKPKEETKNDNNNSAQIEETKNDDR